jgi:PD-(D/E)XK nuclease superfamily
MSEHRNTDENTAVTLVAELCTAKRDRAEYVLSVVTRAPAVHDILAPILAPFPPDGVFWDLWRAAAATAKQYEQKREATHWIFKSFWGSSDEPSHSKFLGFFLDQERPCGRFLLPRFLRRLESALADSKKWRQTCIKPAAMRPFEDTGCTVGAESDGRIDLWIDRDSAENPFSIIIENKIHGATDQIRHHVEANAEIGQLEKYVRRKQKRFPPEKVYAFYLPLTEGRAARTDDIRRIAALGANFCTITFEDDILPWIRESLADWPREVDPAFRAHFEIYRMLIEFLIEQKSQSNMDEEVIEILKKQKNPALNTKDIAAAVAAALSLQRVFSRVLRARFFLKVAEALRGSSDNVNFYRFILYPEVRPVNDKLDEYSNLFIEPQMLVGRECDGVAVGFGWQRAEHGEPEGFFFGYVRVGTGERRENDLVHAEAQKFDAIKTQPLDHPYYAYSSVRSRVDSELESPDEADAVAEQINKMYDGLVKVMPP